MNKILLITIVGCIAMTVVFSLGMFVGGEALHQLISKGCNMDMYVVIDGEEYTCMKTPSGGLPKNDSELRKFYSL